MKLSRRDLLKRAAALPLLGALVATALAEEPPVKTAIPPSAVAWKLYRGDGGKYTLVDTIAYEDWWDKNDQYGIIHRILPQRTFAQVFEDDRRRSLNEMFTRGIERHFGGID